MHIAHFFEMLLDYNLYGHGWKAQFGKRVCLFFWEQSKDKEIMNFKKSTEKE